MGEYVAIGRSLLQHCHWGKKSPLGEGRGRDREIAPTALPLGEEVAIGGRKRSRSGDRSYSIAIGGRGRHWGKMEEVAIGRSLLQHCHWGKRSPLGEGRGRDREIAPTALPLGEEVALGEDGRGRDREIAPTALPLGEEVAIGEDGRGRDREIAPTAMPLGEEVASSFRAFSLIWRVSSLVWRVPSGHLGDGRRETPMIRCVGLNKSHKYGKMY